MTKSTINIWISAGVFTSPYYKFYADSNGTNELINLKVKTNKKYVFHRLNSSTSHPFFITDQGINQEPSNALIIKGDGSVSGGIQGNETFSLEFSTSASDIESLLYYCTSHSSMQDKLSIQNIKKDEISRPSIFKKKFVDKIINFNPTNDIIEIDNDSFDIDSSATFAAGANKKEVKKKLAKQDFDFLYDQKKGGLYFNENGADKGFGDGGIIAILKGAPDLTASNLEFL